MNIVLDTNILIKYPEILSIEDGEFKFYIPIPVVKELKQYRSGIFNLLNKVENKSIIFQDTLIYKPVVFKGAFDARIGEGDFGILEYVIYLKDEIGNVKFASEDIPLIELAQKNDIDTIRLNELKELVENKRRPTKKINTEIENFKSKERRNIILSFVLGFLVAVIAFLIFLNLDNIIGTINVWGTILGILILGIGLFIFREKQRLAYGVAEFLAGIAAVVLIFYPQFDYSSLGFNLSLGLKIFGALYIMVRGQDNIVKPLEGKALGLSISKWLKK